MAAAPDAAVVSAKLAKKLRAAAEREAQRRARAEVSTILERISAESLSAGHARQLAMIRDAALYMIVLCSRRAGKTYGLACLALLTALAGPRRNVLYIGLSKPHARKFLWNEVWCPLLDGLKVPHKRLEDEMTTTFPNGSVMYVSGTDDVRHIESFLGNRLDLAIVDESQSQSDAVLVPLTTRILPNALLDNMDRPGKLVMAGTIPEVNAGRFMEVWNEGKWSKHNWSRFENPHLRNQPAALAAYLLANPGLTEASPEVQREWFGRFAFDLNATAYRFSPALNGYDAQPAAWLDAARAELESVGVPIASMLAAVPMAGIEYFSAALDPGSVDRAALEVSGWGRGSQKVQHVFEWATPRKANVSWGQMGLVCGIVQRRFRPGWWFYDAGSSKNELDVFRRDHNIPVIKAAEKSDLPGQVRRNNGLLTEGKLLVMNGSALAEDYTKARWDPDARAKGLWRWASAWHPDPSEAMRYTLGPYFDAFEKPDPRSREEREHDAFMADDDLSPPERAPGAMEEAIGWR
ncbi:MAG TPA: hypothetical protein VI384_04310 [Candidatus Dormibacteraeota bacterium]